MRVLVTGASGFIGRAVVQALRGRGHDVVCASRRSEVPADFAQRPSRDWWRPHLAGVDVVVNAVGILREQDTQTFAALHQDAPIELFRAAAEAGVRRIVQVSALGADGEAQSRYHLTKKAADDALRALPVPSVIVQPSVVYGAEGASAGMFNTMAVAPLLPLPGGGRMQVQPVHVDDVVAGIVAAVEDGRTAGSATVAFTGPRPLALRDYLAALRRALGWRSRLWVVPVPVGWFRFVAAVMGKVPGSMLDSETAGMLLRGNAAGAGGLAQLLGHEPRPVEDFIAPAQQDALRREAVLGVWLPVLRVAVALVWLWTGIVSLGLYPVQDSYALLARVGLHGALATAALYGAALLDLVLGALTLVAPPRWRPAVWGAQLLLIGGYTLLITLFLPEYWLHPYGPLSKNLPMMAAIALLWALEPVQRPSR
jgi:uncharacterized protein YbjT (DUF2867 family)